MSALKNWFITFLTEKGFYSSEESELLLEDAKDKDMMIGLTVEMQVDFIIQSGYGQKVKDTFVKMDFLNGDCLDYWKHLTNGMMVASGYDKQYDNIKGAA